MRTLNIVNNSVNGAALKQSWSCYAQGTALHALYLKLGMLNRAK